MDYEIIPLAITQPEWCIFIDVCQRVLGYSPTRGLDACHLDIKDPAAYLACLNMANEPLDSLRRGGLGSSWFEHFSITFAMLLDVEGMSHIANTPLHYYWRSGKRRDELLVIVTGNMDEWYRAILGGCQESADYELRWIMNRALNRLEQAGFREVFSRFKKTKLLDDTFIIKHGS